MAEQRPNTGNTGTTNMLTGGMVRDNIDLLKKENSYSFARNATVVLSDGQRGAIHSEPANTSCVTFPYTPIGFIHMIDDQWAVFMTDNVNSEIGIFYEDQCKYESITKGSQKCLNFNQDNLITGAARRGFDCGFNIYWSDGKRNPDRFINTAKVPWVQNCTTPPGSTCVTCVDTNVLDCDKLRLAPLYSIPCLELSKGTASGTLVNGSYQVAVAYTIGEIRVTDYCALSNIQSIFGHSGTGGGVNLRITNAEQDTFSEMEVVIVSMSNGQVQAKRLGTYSTRQSNIYIDDIDQTLPTVALSLLPISNPAIESSDAIYGISNYLCRVGPKEQPDFNYQPLANQIQVNYAVVEYEGDYYHKGGSTQRVGSNVISFPMNVGYLRDEVYAIFIQWCYPTGEYSAAYHIPASLAGSTYSVTGLPSVPGSLGVVAHGRMGHYESEERYPDNQFSVWGSLCGQKIRHHRFPYQSEHGSVAMNLLSHYSQGGDRIRVMALYLENIQIPLDNTGAPIPVQGYRILRASREGNMSILAKGMVNSMRGFTDPYSGQPGLYQNYPYNDLTPDYFMTSDYNTVRVGQANTATNPSSDNLTAPLTTYYNNLLSFHSPDTVFDKPYLGPGTLQVEMLMSGRSTGYFRQSYRHGNFKTLTDFNSILATFLATVNLAIDAINTAAVIAGSNTTPLNLASTEEVPLDIPLSVSVNDYTLMVAGTDAGPVVRTAIAAANVALLVLWAPIKFKTIQAQVLQILKSFAPPRAFAWQWDSHGYYNNFSLQFLRNGHQINDYSYIGGNIQSFANQTVNNLWRNSYVALELGSSIPNIAGLETSRKLMCGVTGISGYGIRPQNNDSVIGPPLIPDQPIHSFYASYKVPQLTQYGQIGSTKNVPISCVYEVDYKSTVRYTTPVLFGGDTYINRYTEKNPFYYFNDWLVDAPPDYEYNYRNYINQPYPRYWIDNTGVTLDILGLMSRLRHLDAQVNAGNINLGLFSISTYVMNGAFYLFNNGVRDFYVESSVNVGYRDWGETIPERFYDPYGFTDVSLMFRSDYLKLDPNIYYKYDYSLSAGKLYNQYISWAQTLRRDYDPELAYTCFSYYPRKLMYSLPQNEEGRRDNWRLYLPQNYKIFNSKVTTIQSVSKTGALILFEDSAPGNFMGVDSIPSQTGTDFAVGTGTLFNQELQQVSNAQDGIQYGSCQNRLGVINTPYGVFWISRDAGKIFQYNGQLKDITNDGIKAWCSLYLPSQTLSKAPDFPLSDNPITGVATQITYDATNEIIYFCKKDYVPTNANWSNGQWYAGLCPPGTGPAGIDPVTGEQLCVACGPSTPGGCKGTVIKFGDPLYFSPASWTLSYDLKTQQWIGYHDWWPDLCMTSSQHFLTSKGRTIYRHNTTPTKYCNYYGVDYPFEIEIPTSTGVTETTLSSVEYLMDSYRYLANGIDKVQLFDGAFNSAMAYNSEQNTGIMPLTLQPFNDPFLQLTYPITTPTGPNILYDKVENRFRLNSFVDLTNDRNRFTPGLVPAIITDATGYRFSLNTPYFNFIMNPLERKRLRYMNTKIWLRKSVVGSNSVSLRYVTTKNLVSKR